MVKIAFSGKMTSGKTTAATMVKNRIPDAKIISFAGKLKELAVDLFDMKNKDRVLLQELGSKMREINKDVWLNYAIKESLKHRHIIIDDLRLENEYKALKNEGFIIVRLDVDKTTQIKRLKQLYPNSWEQQMNRLDHHTEIALDNYSFDYRVDSNKLGNVSKIIDEIITKIF